MKVIYLKPKQHRRLCAGYDVRLSRKRQVYILSVKKQQSKEALLIAKYKEKIRQLQERTKKTVPAPEKPKKQRLHLPLVKCPTCPGSFRRLDRHIAWVHNKKRPQDILRARRYNNMLRRKYSA